MRPVILHVRRPGLSAGFDHWVLCLGCRGGTARVIDPPGGPRDVPLAELLAVWDGQGVVVGRHPAGRLTYAAPGVTEDALALALVAALVLVGRRQPGNGWFLAAVGVGCGILWHVVRADGLLVNPPAVGTVAVQTHDSPVPEVSAAEAAELLARPGTVVIDARIPRDYRNGHLPGAVSLPVHTGWLDLRTAIDGLPRTGRTVVYCQTDRCHWSDIVAGQMRARGRTDVVVLRSGYAGWVQHVRAKPNG